MDVLLPGSIEVFVIDAHFQPAAGARVRLSPGSRSATTGSDGRVLFDRLPIRDYEVEAESTDGRTATDVADLRRQQDVQLPLLLPPVPKPPDIFFHRPQSKAELFLYDGDVLEVFMTFSPETADTYRYRLTSDRAGVLVDRTDFEREVQVTVPGLSLGEHRMEATLTNQHELTDSIRFLVTVTAPPELPVITDVRPVAEGVRVSWTPSTNRAFDNFVVRATYPDQPRFTVGKYFPAAGDSVWIHEEPLYGYDAEYRVEEQLSDHDPLFSDAVHVASEATFAELQEDIVSVLPYPPQNELLVATYGDQGLHFIDQASLAVKASLTVSGGIGDMSLDPDGRHLFIASKSANEILVVDLLTRSIARRIPVPARDPSNTGYLGYADALADPYLTYSGFSDFSNLSVLADKQSGHIADTLLAGQRLSILTVAPEGKTVYVKREDTLEKYRLEAGRLVLAGRRDARITAAGRTQTTSDDRLLLYGHDVLRTDDLNLTVRSFPQQLLGMNPAGTLVGSHDRIYAVESGDEVLMLPFQSRIVALGSADVFFVGSFEPYRTRVYRLPVPSR